MRLYSVTVLQEPKKLAMAPYFYGHILGLKEPLELADCSRWFDRPVYLAVKAGSEADEGATYGGFTGIQLNVVPSADLNPVVAKLRASGIKQPEPSERGTSRVLSVHDPSGNILMLVGTNERPDEPIIEEAVGSLTVFVSDISAARSFYVDTLGLPVRAEPHPGLLVLGQETGTALLCYEVPPENPTTPIGRQTGLAFAAEDPAAVLKAVELGGGTVLAAQSRTLGDGFGFADSDGNTFSVLAESAAVDAARIKSGE